MKCTICGRELVTSKLQALLERVSELGLTFAYRDETCKDFEIEVWDPDQVRCNPADTS